MRIIGTLVLGLVLSGDAWASGCCVGSTTAVPTQLGPSEHGTVALITGAEVSVLRWDRKGGIHRLDSGDGMASTSLGVGVGLSPRWQLGASMPVVANWRNGETFRWGGGAGDLRVDAKYYTSGDINGPVPLVTIGARLPTGRSWRPNSDATAQDITGLAGPALILRAQLEKTTGDTPWVVSINTETGTANGHISPVMTLNAGMGRYWGQRLTFFGNLSHMETLAKGSQQWARAARTTLSGRVIIGSRLRWRAWASLSADLPIPGLGADRTQRMGGTVGYARVW